MGGKGRARFHKVSVWAFFKEFTEEGFKRKKFSKMVGKLIVTTSNGEVFGIGRIYEAWN